MKNKILFLISVLFCCFSIVKAETNVFTKTFDTKTNTYGKTNYASLYKFDNLGIGEDVLTINFTHENELANSKCEEDYCLVIRKYNREGKLLKELYVQNTVSMLSANVIDDELYLVREVCEIKTETNEYEQWKYCLPKKMVIEKYDNGLNLRKTLTIEEFEEYGSSYVWEPPYKNQKYINIFGMFNSAHTVGMPHGFGIDGISIEPHDYDNNYEEHFYDYYDYYQINKENDKIIVYSLYEDYVFDKELKTMSTRSNTWKNKYGGETDYSYNISNPNEVLTSGTIVEGENYIAFLKVNNQEIYKTKDYYAFAFPIKTSHYYAVLGLSNKEKSDILVFDCNNKLVQTISGYYWNLRAVKNGFAVTNLGSSVYNYFANAEGVRNINTEVFYPFIVETKTDGNGAIEYVRYVDGGKEYVEFTITPLEGYVLGKLKVTDSYGKTITFNDYKFSMPTANVLIEATFVKENPNTKDIAIIAIITLAITSMIIAIIQKRKLKELL